MTNLINRTLAILCGLGATYFAGYGIALAVRDLRPEPLLLSVFLFLVSVGMLWFGVSKGGRV